MPGTKNSPEISIIFPCRNEAYSLPACLDELLQTCRRYHLRAQIIVVDNASTDDTPRIAARYGAKVVPCQTIGYGAALHCGLLAAKGEYAAFCDADGSYPVQYFAQMLQLIKHRGADLLLANRLHGHILPHAMPFLNRYAGTPALSWLIRTLFKIPVYDCNSGMRILRTRLYGTLPIQHTGMAYASEMLCLAALKKWKYTEWDLPLFKPDTRRGRPPHLRRWQDGYQHLKTILGIFARRRRL